MTADHWEHWVRLLNLLGSIVLFLGSYRGQKWLKTQAKVLDQATRRRTSAKADNSANPSAIDRGDEFDRAVAAFAIQPYFDRKAYIYLCVGFGVTTVASVIDILSHRSIQILFGVLART
jgi:hypothetical protein